MYDRKSGKFIGKCGEEKSIKNHSGLCRKGFVTPSCRTEKYDINNKVIDI